MSRRKQGIPKKSGDGGDEEEANGDQGADQGPPSVSSEGREEKDEEMPILDTEARRRSPSPASSPPRMSQDDTKVLKMKSPEELLANPMDILKNSPFLLPAQLLALNPQLYAAQLAQLQAAQMMLVKQQTESKEEGGRKRPGE